MKIRSEGVRRWLIMTVLSLSGGIIFLLPFLQEVYYKPLAAALALDNTEVGSLLSVFGVTAMLSYAPGGWLADRVSPRKLLTLSLMLTGGLGLYFASFPSYSISLAIHAVWGVTITLLFWGAMIRVTRNWAPPSEQGRAFGVLETGRGLGEVLSSMAFLAVFGALGSNEFALSTVITLFSALILILGVLSWFSIEDDAGGQVNATDQPKVGFKEILTVLKMPAVWLIAVVILSGYCAYWGTFRFTSYSTDIFAMTVTMAAVISVGKMWTKPLAALVAGYVSDKLGIARSVSFLFVVLIASFSLFALLPGKPSLLSVMLLNVAIASLAVFAMRGIYFALLEEGGIPMAVTGTAAGIISVIGFTPDIFMPLIGGVLLDRFPGPEGYRLFFFMVAGICAVGLAATLILHRRVAASR
ncbi:MAG: MFS transporter [Gammaproteobacteria bacterium]|nr:MFS transporter [Gammaproteobacteria bacterium]